MSSTQDIPEPTGSFGVLSKSSEYTGVIDVEKLFKLDDESLSEEEQEVLEKDEFVIYGKANIEQFDMDDPPQKIRMEAFKDALDQFFAQGGLITRRHKDVTVGEALKEYTLDEPSTVELADGEILQFDAGDTVTTRVEDDTLWVAANIFGENDDRGSTLSKQTRLGAFHDLLDGFSVTVFSKEYAPREEGQDVLEIDFHAITIGDEKLVKNKGSSFDLLQMKLQTDDAIRAEVLGNYIQNKMSSGIFNNLFSKSKENLAVETIKVAQKEELPLDEASEQVVDEDDVEPVVEEAEEKLQYMEEQLDEKQEQDLRDLAADVADELGMSTGEVLEVFDQLEGETTEDKAGEDNDDDDDDDEMDEKMEEVIEEKLDEKLDEKLGEKDFVTQDDIEGLATKEDLEEGLDTAAGNIADNISEKMETGDTPDPSGGSDNEQTDIDSEVDQLVEKFE